MIIRKYFLFKTNENLIYIYEPNMDENTHISYHDNFMYMICQSENQKNYHFTKKGNIIHIYQPNIDGKTHISCHAQFM